MKPATFRPSLPPVADSRDYILLDECGRQLDDRLAGVLMNLIPRFKRTFKMFRDDTTIVDVIEEAGRRIAQREARFGPVERIHSYAWVTLVSAATTLLRRGPARLEGQGARAGGSGRMAASLVATIGTAEQIERAILIREMLDHLPLNQRRVCLLRLEGFTSREIARNRGCSAAAVNNVLWRARLRLRQLACASGIHPNSDTQAFRTSRTVSAARDRRPEPRRVPIESGHSDAVAARLTGPMRDFADKSRPTRWRDCRA